MFVTTMDGVAGHVTQETLGLVRGTSLWTRRIAKTSFGGIRNIEVTGIKQLDAGLNACREEAHRQMHEQATKMGADAIVAVRIDVTELSNGVFCVNATGTAVKVVKLPASVPSFSPVPDVGIDEDFDYSFLAAKPAFAGSLLRH